MRLASNRGSAADGLYEAVVFVEDAMADLSNFEIARAFSEAGCPLCRVLRVDEERSMQQFWRDSRLLPAVRRSFFASGGFCLWHSWLFHSQVTHTHRAGALAELYSNLVARDIRRIDTIVSGGGERPDEIGGRLAEFSNRSSCRECDEFEAAAARRARSAWRLLREPSMEAAYRSSDGFCFRHLQAVLVAGGDEDLEVASMLVRDWRNRLAALHDRLQEFDRRRDYRYSHEQPGDEREAPSDAVRRYAGEQPEIEAMMPRR